MKVTALVNGLAAIVAVAELTACSGGAQAPVVFNASQSTLRPADADDGSSWMAPEAKKKDLLYVSDYSSPHRSNSVWVYSYPEGKLVGKLSGFREPAGQCVDKAGDVFVTDFGASRILEYAHGGTSPINTLDDSGYAPQDCSIDPTTGNLAVVNYLSLYSSRFGPGNVAIYPNAIGLPTYYSAPNVAIYFYCGYDNSGNLYVDGGGRGYWGFAELLRGASSLTDLTLNQKFKLPGAIQWDGSHLAVGDQDAHAIYEFAINGSKGTKVGTTPLVGSSHVAQFWIQDGRVIAPDALFTKRHHLRGRKRINFYQYPTGGSPTKIITGVRDPVGATVSSAK
ncbi:MAG: hypothetical protein WBV40_13765 [Candidatus Cybelea sp.]